MSTPQQDTYQLNQQLIKDPPTTFWGRLGFLGPGFILSASIVGSGELIATTTLGARAGFLAFWVILVSCLVKVVIQMEFGKHAIHSGETVMAAFNQLPGPRLGKAHWTVWAWVLLMTSKILQVGGVIGGTALAMKLAFPTISIEKLTWATAVVAALLTFRGYYRFVERGSLFMMAVFTIFTVACLAFVQYTPYAFSAGEIGSGLRFELPAAMIVVAVGAFGITGVGGDEIIFYNYWCIEKGYALWTGPRDDSPQWLSRAKGWIKVMYLDALVAMLVYTLVTAAFYLLGAAVLNRMGKIPEGNETIEVLSNMYTQSFGPWAKPFFLAGAFIVLFSTVFAALASWIRAFTDSFGHLGWIDFSNIKQRKTTLAILAWFLPLAWATAYLLVKLPVLMVLSGGIVGSFILCIVVYAAVYFRYKRLPAALYPGRLYDTFFWLSTLAVAWLAVYGVLKLFGVF